MCGRPRAGVSGLPRVRADLKLTAAGWQAVESQWLAAQKRHTGNMFKKFFVALEEHLSNIVYADISYVECGGLGLPIHFQMPAYCVMFLDAHLAAAEATSPLFCGEWVSILRGASVTSNESLQSSSEAASAHAISAARFDELKARFADMQSQGNILALYHSIVRGTPTAPETTPTMTDSIPDVVRINAHAGSSSQQLPFPYSGVDGVLPKYGVSSSSGGRPNVQKENLMPDPHLVLVKDGLDLSLQHLKDDASRMRRSCTELGRQIEEGAQPGAMLSGDEMAQQRVIREQQRQRAEIEINHEVEFRSQIMLERQARNNAYSKLYQGIPLDDGDIMRLRDLRGSRLDLALEGLGLGRRNPEDDVGPVETNDLPIMGVLSCMVMSASGLPDNPYWIGQLDPFFVLQYVQQEDDPFDEVPNASNILEQRYTTIKPGETDPVWREVFHFDILRGQETLWLVCILQDGNNTLSGVQDIMQCRVSLREFCDAEDKTVELELSACEIAQSNETIRTAHSKVQLRFHYEPKVLGNDLLETEAIGPHRVTTLQREGVANTEYEHLAPLSSIIPDPPTSQRFLRNRYEVVSAHASPELRAVPATVIEADAAQANTELVREHGSTTNHLEPQVQDLPNVSRTADDDGTPSQMSTIENRPSKEDTAESVHSVFENLHFERSSGATKQTLEPQVLTAPGADASSSKPVSKWDGSTDRKQKLFADKNTDADDFGEPDFKRETRHSGLNFYDEEDAKKTRKRDALKNLVFGKGPQGPFPPEYVAKFDSGACLYDMELTPPMQVKEQTLDEVFNMAWEARRAGQLGDPDLGQLAVDYAFAVAMEPREDIKYVSLLIDVMRRYPVSGSIIIWGLDGIMATYRIADPKPQLAHTFFNVATDMMHLDDYNVQSRILVAFAVLSGQPTVIFSFAHIDFALRVLNDNREHMQPSHAEACLQMFLAARIGHRANEQINEVSLALDRFMFDNKLSARGLVCLAVLVDSLVVERSETKRPRTFLQWLKRRRDTETHNLKLLAGDLREVFITVNVMNLYCDDRMVQAAGLQCLVMLAQLGNDYCAAIATHGIKIARHAQQNHIDFLTVQLQFCYLLKNVIPIGFRQDDDHASAGVDPAVVSNLFSVVRRYPEDPDVFGEALGCLVMCVSLFETQAGWISNNDLEEIIRYGESFDADPIVASNTCALLLALANKSRDMRKRLAKLGAVSVPVTILHSCELSEEVQQGAMLALAALVYNNRRGITHVKRLAVLPRVMQSVQRFQISPGVVMAGMQFLANLLVTPEYAEMRNPFIKGALPEIITALKLTVAEDPEVFAQACRLLQMYVSSFTVLSSGMKGYPNVRAMLPKSWPTHLQDNQLPTYPPYVPTLFERMNSANLPVNAILEIMQLTAGKDDSAYRSLCDAVLRGHGASKQWLGPLYSPEEGPLLRVTSEEDEKRAREFGAAAQSDSLWQEWLQLLPYPIPPDLGPEPPKPEKPKEPAAPNFNEDMDEDDIANVQARYDKTYAEYEEMWKAYEDAKKGWQAELARREEIMNAWVEMCKHERENAFPWLAPTARKTWGVPAHMQHLQAAIVWQRRQPTYSGWLDKPPPGALSASALAYAKSNNPNAMWHDVLTAGLDKGMATQTGRDFMAQVH